MSFAATIQRPLEIGQKISKAFLRNCLHIITVAWTTQPKQFQLAFCSSKNKENALTVASALLSSRHAGNSNTSLFNRKLIRNIRTKTKVLDRKVSFSSRAPFQRGFLKLLSSEKSIEVCTRWLLILENK